MRAPENSPTIGLSGREMIYLPFRLSLMLRFISSLILIVIFCFAASAQNPVSWKLKSDAHGQDAAKTFTATLTAAIEAPWHLYAIEQPKGGPIPTAISVPEGSPFQIKGKIASPGPIEKFDENFKIATKFFEKQVTFTIPLSATAAVKVDDLAL